jgi:hypothetical protein
MWSVVRDLDWGSVPAWFGAISLVLAFVIFARDRAKSERSQVDLIGVWGEPTWDMPEMTRNPAKRVQGGTIQLFARNASQLPVEIAYIAFELHTAWMVPVERPDDLQVWEGKPGTEPGKAFIGPVRIAPDKTWEGQPQEFDLAHTAPHPEAQLWMLVGGITCRIRFVLVLDNAGRRWETRPGAGRRARRIRWYSRRRQDFPYEWKHPITMKLARTWHALRARVSEFKGKARWPRKAP